MEEVKKQGKARGDGCKLSAQEEGRIYTGTSEELRREEPRERAPSKYSMEEYEHGGRKREGIDEIFKSPSRGLWAF